MKKILVTFVEAGFGHIVAAQAILDALNEANDGNAEIIAKDLFKENPTLIKYENFLISETKKASKGPLHSNIQLAFMKIIGSQNTLKFVHSTVYKKQVALYVKELEKIKPDVIIDTHYFTSYASVYYRDHVDHNCKVVTYDPDNNVHGWWFRKVDYFIVNNDLAYSQALKCKFNKEKVVQVPFIARQNVIGANESKEFYRNKFGLPQDGFIVKIADGAYAQAKLESFVREFKNCHKPVTILAIAGKNESKYNKLVKLKEEMPKNVNLIPFGFVKNIEELFKASDLFITKAGPNAVLDSVYMQVPFVINYWANKIEKTTKELFADKLSCGLVIKNKVKAREFVERCIGDRTILDKYIINARKIDKTKNGANNIADLVLNRI